MYFYNCIFIYVVVWVTYFVGVAQGGWHARGEPNMARSVDALHKHACLVLAHDACALMPRPV